MAALVRADRPRRADVARAGDQRVVAALAVDPADRVDRRQVQRRRSPSPATAGQPLGGGGEGAVLDRGRRPGRPRRPRSAGRTRTRPRTAPACGRPRSRTTGSWSPARAPGAPRAARSRSSAGETRANSDRWSSRSAAAASRTRSCSASRHDLGGQVEHVGALGEVVGQVLEALAGADLLDHGVAPGQVRVVERLDGERPPADRVRLDRRRATGRGRASPGRIRVNGSACAVRALPDHVHAEGVVAFAIGHRRDRHELADHRLGRVAAARHRRASRLRWESVRS